MRKKRDPVTDEQRTDRVEKEAQRRSDSAAQEEMSIDEMVKRSIKLHGA